MANPAELSAMRRAIALSVLGLGTTSPNPPVGCVILDTKGRIVGQGHHQRKGEPHAEAHALAAAGQRAAGGTAVVTLEPCNHHGRTPPCHQALIDAKVTRVVIALIDPTSRTQGGAQRLQAAGVDVEVGTLADEARLVLGPWLTALDSRRPHVTWAYVVGDDAPMAALDAVSAVVTADALRLRARNDVVLFEDGHLEEGAPNSHGRGMLDLATQPLSAGPPAVLASLHAGGARLALLNIGWAPAEPFVRAGLVDQVIAYLAADGSATGPRTSEHAAVSLLPPGFEMANIERLDDHVKIVGVQNGSAA